MSELEPHFDIIQTFSKADIIQCIRALNELKMTNEKLVPTVINGISIMFDRFSKKSFIPTEYAEALTAKISEFLDIRNDYEPPYILFASNEVFIACLYEIFLDFNNDGKSTVKTHVYSSYLSESLLLITLFTHQS